MRKVLVTASIALGLVAATACLDGDGSLSANPDGTAVPGPTVTVAASPAPSPVATARTTPVMPGITPTSSSAAPRQDTGFQGAGSERFDTGGDGNGFESNPAAALLADGLEAADMDSGTTAAASCFNFGKDRHIFGEFDLALPPTALVDGIEVGFQARADGAVGKSYFCVQLSWDSGLGWSEPGRTAQLTETSSFLVAGDPTDRWLRSWVAPELSKANLLVRVISVSDNPERDFFLDWIAVRVTYH